MQTTKPLDSKFLLVGAVIRLAVRDSFSPYRRIRSEAQDFIFSKRVENFLCRFHLDNQINIQLLRRGVKKGLARNLCPISLIK